VVTAGHKMWNVVDRTTPIVVVCDSGVIEFLSWFLRFELV